MITTLNILADIKKMRFQQIIEMVCDCAGAHLAYGNKGEWHSTSVKMYIEKYPFMPEQKWLIRDVSLFLSSRIVATPRLAMYAYPGPRHHHEMLERA